MGRKLDKGAYPKDSGPSDFQCFGPPAIKDGEFDTVKICDMGCFTQDDKDSNKYYHGAVVQHRSTKKWYTYFEWGRTGASKPSFQFIECDSEADAQREFASQLHDKNDKRGMWITVAGIRTLKAKPGKDCYLVRPQATRATGLPDAKTIKLNEGAKVKLADKKPSAKPSKVVDDHTLRLMRDLSVATVSYTRGAMADTSLPTQAAIDEARNLLQEAQKRVLVVGDLVDRQIKDRDLVQITTVLYSRIPKKKVLHVGPEEWILSSKNILAWQTDIDAFEAALYSTDIEDKPSVDPFAGMPLHMEWIDPKSNLGKFLYTWWPRASAGRHSYLKNMTIKNLWRVDRHGDQDTLHKAQDVILVNKPSIRERPLFQPERQDLQDSSLMKRYYDSNTGLLFHGSRSVNITGILRESFRLPKELVGVVITGAAYGPGIYTADDWRKSAGYTSLSGGYYSSGSGGVRGRDAFMFACDVVLGNPYIAKGSYGYTAAPHPHHSVYAKGGASGVINNEFIVYNKTQIKLRYLAEFVA